MTGEEFETDEGTAVTVAGLPFILISSIVSSSHKRMVLTALIHLQAAVVSPSAHSIGSHRRHNGDPKMFLQIKRTSLYGSAAISLSRSLSLCVYVCVCRSALLLSQRKKKKRRKRKRKKVDVGKAERRRKVRAGRKKKVGGKSWRYKKKRQRRRRRHYITAPVLINQPQQKHMLIDIFMYMQIYHSGGPRDGGNPEMPASLSIYIHSRNTTYTAHTHTV